MLLLGGVKMNFETNAPYPGRIQWILSGYTGPFTQAGPLGNFNPTRDLDVYVDGLLTTIRTFSFDSPNNRYLLDMDSTINLQGVIQIVHYMPNPPFMDISSPPFPIPGFASIASYSTQGDISLTPYAVLAAYPSSTTVHAPITLIWNTSNIVQVEITANNGHDAPFDSGLINVQGGVSIYPISGGMSVTTTFTMAAYDTIGHLALSPTTVVTIT